VKLKYGAIIFLLGLLAGGVLSRFMSPWLFHRFSHDRRQDKLLRRISAELDLDPGQKEKIAAIFASTRPEMDALISDVRPRFEAIRNAAAAQIRQLLTPDQQTKFDQSRKRREDRWKQAGEPLYMHREE
jgi:Spy/CpxP family protein refolding chaperone